MMKVKIKLYTHEIKLFADIVYTISNSANSQKLSNAVIADYYEENRTKLINKIMTKQKREHTIKLPQSVSMAFNDIMINGFTPDENNQQYLSVIRKILDNTHRQLNTITHHHPKTAIL